MKDTTSPFDTASRSPHNEELVERVSGSRAAADMRELLGSESGSSQSGVAGLELSEDEAVAATAAEQMATPEQVKKQFLQWAEDNGKEEVWDEDWLFGDLFKIQPDGRVIVEGTLDLSVSELESLPPFIYEVAGDFYFNNNQITSLQGMPERVGGTISFASCQLDSLVGLPKETNKHLFLNNNQITSLQGMPERVGGGLSLKNNPNLTDLNDFPKHVHGGVYLENVPATSIPTGLYIGGKIHIRRQQTELIASCQDAGYKLEIVG